MLSAILLSVAMLSVMMVIVIKRNFLALNVLKLAAHHSTREDGSNIRYEPLWGVEAPDSDAYQQHFEFILINVLSSHYIKHFKCRFFIKRYSKLVCFLR